LQIATPEGMPPARCYGAVGGAATANPTCRLRAMISTANVEQFKATLQLTDAMATPVSGYLTHPAGDPYREAQRLRPAALCRR